MAWDHYLVLMAIPIVVAFQRLSRREFQGRDSILLLTVALLINMPSEQVVRIQMAFATPSAGTEEQILPFAAGLLSLIYAAGVLAMLWFLWHLDRGQAAASGVR